MKKLLLKSIALPLFFAAFNLNAQDFQGKAVYQTKATVEMDLEKSGIPADRIKRIKEMMKSQLEKTYILTFDKTTSIYKEEEKLAQSGGGRGMRFMMMGGSGAGKHYKNVQEKKSSKEREVSGKNFLINDALTKYSWKMEQETKMIGENLCFKATAVIEVPKRQAFRFGRRNNNEKDTTAKEAVKKETEQQIITAWYTLNIPVSHGPGDYWGLPGLILEVSAGNTKIMCTKIVMNPKEKIAIAAPKKGKEVTQKEFDAIMVKLRKDMEERFGNQRKKGSRGRHIRIGG